MFTDDIRKHLDPCWCLSVWFCSNTDFAFIFISFQFFLWLYVRFCLFLFCWVLCWLVLIGLNNKWMAGVTGEKHAYPKGGDLILIDNKCNTTLPPLPLFLVGGHLYFLDQWWGQQQHNRFVCLLDIFLFLFLLHSQTYTVLLWPWQSLNGILGLAGLMWILTQFDYRLK